MIMVVLHLDELQSTLVAISLIVNILKVAINAILHSHSDNVLTDCHN